MSRPWRRAAEDVRPYHAPRLLASSRPCTLAKTDCGVARYSGRRSHIGLCQNCVCEASAFQRRTPTRRPRQARPSRVAHGRARRPRRAVYAKTPAGTPRTRGRPRQARPSRVAQVGASLTASGPLQTATFAFAAFLECPPPPLLCPKGWKKACSCALPNATDHRRGVPSGSSVRKSAFLSRGV